MSAPLVPLACESCGATGVPLDLDTKATPPEVVCRKCIKKAKCDRCRRRVSRRVLVPPMAHAGNGEPIYFRGERALCLRCER